MSLPNSPQITQVLHHGPFISFIRIANIKHWMSKSSCFQTTRLFWNSGIQKWKKKTPPLPLKLCILGSHFTRPHLLTFSQALSHLYTFLPSANPRDTKLLGKWGKMLLGWQTQLQKHKSHKSEKALCSFGFAFICSSGTASMGGSVTACSSVSTWQSTQKILGGHEGTWLWFYSFLLYLDEKLLIMDLKEKTRITEWFG